MPFLARSISLVFDLAVVVPASFAFKGLYEVVKRLAPVVPPPPFSVSLPRELLEQIFDDYIGLDPDLSPRLHNLRGTLTPEGTRTARCNNVATLSSSWRLYGQQKRFETLKAELLLTDVQVKWRVPAGLVFVARQPHLARLVRRFVFSHNTGLDNASFAASRMRRSVLAALEHLPALTSIEVLGADPNTATACLQGLAWADCRVTLTSLRIDSSSDVRRIPAEGGELSASDLSTFLAACPRLNRLELNGPLTLSPPHLLAPSSPAEVRHLAFNSCRLYVSSGFVPLSNLTSIAPTFFRQDTLEVLHVWWSPAQQDLLEWIRTDGWRLSTLRVCIVNTPAPVAYSQVTSVLPFHPQLASFGLFLSCNTRYHRHELADFRSLTDEDHLKPLLNALPATVVSLRFPFPFPTYHIRSDSGLSAVLSLKRYLRRAVDGLSLIKEVNWVDESTRAEYRLLLRPEQVGRQEQNQKRGWYERTPGGTEVLLEELS